MTHRASPLHRRVHAAALTAAVLLGLSAVVPVPAAEAVGSQWLQLGDSPADTISGLAPAPTGWLLVRDTKKVNQNRVALLDLADRVTELDWPGTAPVDLEAVDAVPGRSGQYLAVTSAGVGYHFAADSGGVTVLRQLSLPRGSAVEGFALTQTAEGVLAVWAGRGSTTKPAKLFAAAFDPSSGTFGRIATAGVTVPYPTTDVRQVSDLKVVGGRLVVASTSDPGSLGPFDSALYDVGSVVLTQGRARLTTTPPVSLGTYPGHKVEGIACSGGTGLLGSDDEKLGGWIRTASICG